MKKILTCLAVVASVLGNSHGMSSPQEQDVGSAQDVKQTNVAEAQGQNGYYTLVSGETFERPLGRTSIGNTAYAHWYNLVSMTLPTDVTRIEAFAFANCYNLKEVKSKNVINYIGQSAFGGCISLTLIILSEGTTVNTPDETCRKIIKGGAFGNCKSLTSIEIPSGITEIEDYAFSGCENLASITIPASVTIIGGAAFYGCPNLKQY